MRLWMGLEAIEQIRAQFPRIAIIVLTTCDEDELILRSLQAEVRSYFLKNSDLATVLQAIERGACSEMLPRLELVQHLLDYSVRRNASTA